MLDAYIKERGIPAAELARRITRHGHAMSRQYFNNIIHGARTMPPRVAEILAEDVLVLDPDNKAEFYAVVYPNAAPSVEAMAMAWDVEILTVWEILLECSPKLKAK